ncbi:MAG: TonB-dependent receptor [Acidobacteriaceae bacterium]
MMQTSYFNKNYFNKKIISFVVLFTLFCMAGMAQGQQPASSTSVVRGRVADPTGAVIPGATITLTPAKGAPLSVESDGEGLYVIRNVPQGSYTLTVQSAGFSPYQQLAVQVGRLQSLTLNVKLSIETQTQQVVVTDHGTALDTSPDNNASAMVIKGKDLDALSDDPDELSDELQALAGPAAGPNGGQIYVDGFTGGQLPPKSSIREIRINQNPFSAEFDKLGYGRIEIFTKPGTDKYHGQFQTSANTSGINTTNPFVKNNLPPYNTLQYFGYVSGPINKKASFFFSASRRNIADDNIVSTPYLNPDLTINNNFTDAVPSPRHLTMYSPRFDFQLGENNTLTVRYQYTNSTQQNSGVGGFKLASQGTNTSSTENTLQISDTQILSDRVINETRFRYMRDRDNIIALSNTPTISVQGAFTGGGSNAGNSRDAQDNYELQNYTSIQLKNNFIRFGSRLRALRDSNYSASGYNGHYIFNSIQTYQAAEQALQGGSTTVSGASQYSVTQGTPAAKLTYADLGLYAEDDWKAKPNLTLSYGLRFETQTGISNKANFAPRVAVAWGIGQNGNKPPKTVLRAGYGVFYDRFGSGNILQAERENGITQTQYIVENPDFYPSSNPPQSDLQATSPTVYQIAPNLHASYTMQFGATLERSLSKSTTLALTYLNSRGVHQYLSLNANAPNPADGGLRPNPNAGNIYQYASEGVYKQNQFIANIRSQISSRFSVFAFYILNFAKSDTSGAGSFASNSYNISQDYGDSSFDRRNRFIVVGNIQLPFQIIFNPFIIYNSGAPFNITTGQDNNGDSIYNDRPAFATDLSRPSVVQTKYGNFDTDPIAGETLVPINYERGPSQFSGNLRISRAFGIGPRVKGGGASAGGPPGGGGHHGGHFGMVQGGRGPMGATTVPRKYAITFSAHALNLFNNINYASPVGTLTSPLFGKSNSLAGGIFSTNAASRRIFVQAAFSF